MSLSTRLQDLAVRAGTEDKALRTLINGNAANLSALTTTAQNNLVAAINEVKQIADAGGGSSYTQEEIEDFVGAMLSGNTETGITVTYDDTNGKINFVVSITSSEVTDFNTAVDARVALVVDAAPAALDTLNELAAALGDDPNFAGTITTALGLRVRVDAAQGFDSTQQAQGRDNIGAASTTALAATQGEVDALETAVGDTDHNFVTTFEAALV